jgi:hypothetical protein
MLKKIVNNINIYIIILLTINNEYKQRTRPHKLFSLYTQLYKE